MNKTSLSDLDQITNDAAKWRELTGLLREKAYKAMTPREISEQLPDLRQIYRELNHRSNGHSHGVTH
jgi:hypothetical protein